MVQPRDGLVKRNGDVLADVVVPCFTFEDGFAIC